MIRLILAATLLTFPAMIGAQAPVAPQPSNGEWLLRGDLPGFILGFEHHDIASIEEYVAAGETVEDWSRMVTVQTFSPRVHQGRGAADILQTIRGSLPRACPGAQVTAIRSFEDHGNRGAAMQSDCPQNPATGLPETTWFHAIGGQNVYIVQIAYRHVASPAEVRWAEDYLATVTLCPPQSLGECP